SELKQLHHMFHTLEGTLAVLEALNPSIGSRKTHPNIEVVRTHWQMAVLPKIAVIEDFATNELRFIGPPLEHLEGKIKGPVWITDLLTLRQAFEESLKEKNAHEIAELSQSSLTLCHG